MNKSTIPILVPFLPCLEVISLLIKYVFFQIFFFASMFIDVYL